MNNDINGIQDMMKWEMLPFLNLLETIDLSRLNKDFNLIVRDHVGLSSKDINNLHRIFKHWRLVHKRRRKRSNSWVRVTYHPDERVIM